MLFAVGDNAKVMAENRFVLHMAGSKYTAANMVKKSHKGIKMTQSDASFSDNNPRELF